MELVLKDDDAMDDFAGLMVFDGRGEADLDGVDSTDLTEGVGGGPGPVLVGRGGRFLFALPGLDKGFGGGGGGAGLRARAIGCDDSTLWGAVK